MESKNINSVNNSVLTENTIAMTNEMKSVCQFDKIANGTYGATLVTLAEHTMRKKENPYFGRVQKVTKYSQFNIGVMMYNYVNNECKREGIEAEHTPQSAPRGMKYFQKFDENGNLQFEKDKDGNLKPIYNKKFYQSTTDPNKFYLKVGMTQRTKVSTTYFVDGIKATEEQLSEIKYIDTHNLDGSEKKVSESDFQNQNDVQKRYIQNSVKLSNILLCWQGTNLIYKAHIDASQAIVDTINEYVD